MKDVDAAVVSQVVTTLLRELIAGADAEAGWVLNPGDPGLLRSLDRLSAEQASAVPPGGSSSVASHVEHVRFGLELLTRATTGENPFAGADWTAAWHRRIVSDAEWERLRHDLREVAGQWQARFQTLVGSGETELTGVVASVAHLAYHLGAIRQLAAATRGSAEGT
jgi:hypothetical protein